MTVRDKDVGKFFEGLEWLVYSAKLLEHFTSEFFKVTKVNVVFSLEFLPIVDMEECTLFVKRHVLEKKLDFG